MTPEIASRTFKSVWYRSKPYPRRWPFGGIRVYEDAGTLVVERGRVTFEGRRVRVALADPTVAGVNHHGADTFNWWVELIGGDGERALFADGSRLGWGGALGGNDQLAAAIREAQQE